MDAPGYRESPAAPAARPVVRCVWISAAPPGGRRTQLVVPDGCVDVFLGSGELWVAGPDTAAWTAHVVQDGPLVAVRMRPGTAEAVLGVPADALLDVRVPLVKLWGPAAERLADRLGGAARPERALEATLVAGAGTVDRAAMRVAQLVAGSAAGIPATGAGATGTGSAGIAVPELADEVGLSERQLRRRCIAAFGYGPKMLHRVLRFQHALRRARTGEELGAVAYAAGYADQAHLARDVAALSGTTLTRLR